MATVEAAEDWRITFHAEQRWRQRVSDGDPYVEIPEFLREASFRRSMPRWVTKHLLRHGRRTRGKARNEPILFAVSPAWPGVCLVVHRADRAIVTVVCREAADAV